MEKDFVDVSFAAICSVQAVQFIVNKKIVTKSPRYSTIQSASPNSAP